MKGNKISILGAGESGVGSAILAKLKGFDVFVSDSGRIKEKYKNVLLHHEIAFEEGKHNEERILDADEVIKSPGIPDNVPLVMKIMESVVPLISEIEFAGRYTDAFKICITGSNGKTTTTLLIHHILKNAGVNVSAAGNVGKSFAWQVAMDKHDFYVLEISSFQLDGMFDFRADCAVIMNITPDHLGRYENSFDKYTDSKFRILQNQRSTDSFIYNYDDPVISKEIKKRKIKARKYPFSLYSELQVGGMIEKNKMVIKTNRNKFIMTLEDLALQGKHNIYNSMAASIAARILDIRKDSVKQSMSDFQNIEHRLEYVAGIHGIQFINDSKATNVNSTWYALESVDAPVIWIAGGVDKGNNYEVIKDLVSKKVKAIVCLGADNQRLHQSFGDVIDR
ncbi:MAG: UDP-N-acetylmuramoyl-L-alanine--D-glutamate ligase, partial [Bacteroidales bacterium]|nr:UDP-N-acetylmuramoyl-L-alanine--D-glutamate ligase [Bacteroidales bacterium]